MAYCYHITCFKSESKKIVSTSSKDSIKDEIRKKFSISGEFIIQLPYEENDWVDLNNVSCLPDSGKLRIILTESTQSGSY